MTRFVHIVQVHPVENGKPNTYKVKLEREFETEEKALGWIEGFNELCGDGQRAVYMGRVNDATGELV